MIKDIDFIHNNTGSFEHTFPHEHYWVKDGKVWERFDDFIEWLNKLKGN